MLLEKEKKKTLLIFSFSSLLQQFSLCPLVLVKDLPQRSRVISEDRTFEKNTVFTGVAQIRGDVSLWLIPPEERPLSPAAVSPRARPRPILWPAGLNRPPSCNPADGVLAAPSTDTNVSDSLRYRSLHWCSAGYSSRSGRNGLWIREVWSLFFVRELFPAHFISLSALA